MSSEQFIRDGTEPQFNSALAYLERIHHLIINYQLAMRSKDLDSAYNFLKEWHSEINPRCNDQQRKILLLLEKNIDELHFNSSASKGKAMIIYEKKLRTYARELHQTTHELKLVMVDKKNTRSLLG